MKTKKLTNKSQILDLLLGELRAAIQSATELEETHEVERLRSLEQVIRFLPRRDFSGPGEVVCPSALVELEVGGIRSWALVLSSEGGWITSIDESPLQIVSVRSPLGEALLGQMRGSEVILQAGRGGKTYRVVSVF